MLSLGSKEEAGGRSSFVGFRVRGLRRRMLGAFTLLELLVVVAVVGILASLLLPALSGARSRGLGIQCLSNTRQLTLAWLMYADDHQGRLPYNVGAAGSARGVAGRHPQNWADGILDWELTPDNTNLALLSGSGLGPYVGGAAALYRCPADRVLSARQRAAGWVNRARSYAMNAMVGDAGEASSSGRNENNPYHVQFFGLDQIPVPAWTFVFVDEHPDSVNDGYFLNRSGNPEWIDLPASQHGGAAAFSFADGHAVVHRWIESSTRQPARPDGAVLPLRLGAGEVEDWRWVIQRMSVTSPTGRAPSYAGGE